MISSRLSALVFVIGAIASPLPKRDSVTITDTIVFQYALGLEHIEQQFYTQGLQQFDESAFASAGFAPIVRQRFQQIAEHETTHANLLTKALGNLAPQPCTYTFPYTDVKSFAALSQVFEGVGTSAYLGAAGFITDKDNLEIAGSILTTEARQAAWVASSVNSDTPWSGAFEVPLDFNQVTTLASAFIVSCPTSNPSLPFKAFPGLTLSPAMPSEGATVTLSFDGSSTSGLYLSLLTGLSTISVPIENGSATLPSNLAGTVYAIVTKSNGTVSDDATVAGPTILQFPDNE
jgi:rubrerythrin